MIGHLVADYILQNDWQARKKKNKTFPCLVHVFLYTLSIWVFTSWPLWAISAVAITHFVQDRTDIIRKYMLAIGQKEFASGVMAPWSIVVVDNVFHLVTLFFISLYCALPQVIFLGV